MGWVGEGGGGSKGGKGREITHTLYAYMNKRKKDSLTK
jgi:hypothetical protein